MKITVDLYERIVKMIPSVPPETGGILGERNGVICTVVFDGGDIQIERYAYIPNVERLNEVISQWASEGIRFTGIFHSHPGRQEGLSLADKAYIQRIMDFMPDAVHALHFPIVLPGDKMIGHIAEKVDGQVMVRQEPIIIAKE